MGASDETIRGLCEFRHLRELDLCQIVAGDSNKITPAGLEVRSYYSCRYPPDVTQT